MVLATWSIHFLQPIIFFFALHHSSLTHEMRAFSTIPISKGVKRERPQQSGNCKMCRVHSSAMPNHHPLPSTFMESSWCSGKYHQERFLLTHIPWYYSLSHFLSLRIGSENSLDIHQFAREKIKEDSLFHYFPKRMVAIGCVTSK